MERCVGLLTADANCLRDLRNCVLAGCHTFGLPRQRTLRNSF